MTVKAAALSLYPFGDPVSARNPRETLSSARDAGNTWHNRPPWRADLPEEVKSAMSVAAVRLTDQASREPLYAFAIAVLDRHYSATSWKMHERAVRYLCQQLTVAQPRTRLTVASLFQDSAVEPIVETQRRYRKSGSALRHVLTHAVQDLGIEPALLPPYQRLMLLLRRARPGRQQTRPLHPHIAAYGGAKPEPKEQAVMSAVARFQGWLVASGRRFPNITARDIADWCSDRRSGLSRDGYRAEVKRLKQWLRWAQPRGFIPASIQVDAIRIPRRIHRPNDRCLNEDEAIGTMVAALSLERMPYQVFAIFAAMVATGARLAALLRLKWHMIRVNPDGSWAIPLIAKHLYYRTLPPSAEAALRLHCSVHPNSEWVFSYENGCPLNKTFVQRQFKKCLLRAGITRDVKGPHVFRHTHGTLLAERHRPTQVRLALGLRTRDLVDLYAKSKSENRLAAVNGLDYEEE